MIGLVNLAIDGWFFEMWALENVHPKHSKVGPLQVQNGVVSYGPYFGGSPQDL